MTLRQKVIEAGAEAMYEADDISDVAWEDQVDRNGVRGWYRGMIAIGFDAMLDCLTKNLDDRDRWDDVLAVLREDR